MEALCIVGVADVGAFHTHKWANAFAARGHRVHLVSYATYPESVRDSLYPGVSVDRWTIPAFHVRRPWITIPAISKLRRIVKDHAADLVQVHFLGPGAWYAALAGGAPLALWVMGGGDVQGATWRPASVPERLLSPLALGRAALVTAWSRNLARIVQPMVRAHVPCEVVVGGVDTDFFRRNDRDPARRTALGLDPEDFVIFSGRLLWPRQNILTIVRALPLVRKALPRARLLIVKYRAEQAPEYLREVEAEIDRLSLRPFVILVPQIPNAEMPAHFSAVDCVISIPDTDGTPMTVMEAAACETPCLVHDLPDYDPEIFVHGVTVLRVPVGNSEALAAGLVRLATDADLRQRLRRGGREMAERYANYAREMSRLENLYRRVLGRTA